MEETPLNAAHAFANIAEEAEENEQWAKAMESHFRAAEQFLLAKNYSSAPEAIRTLTLLCKKHTHQGKDIQRRLANQPQQARANSAAKPTRSQHNPLPASSPTSQQTNNLYDLTESTADDGADGMQVSRRRHAVAASSGLHTGSMENSDESTSTSGSSKIDESYMVLKGSSNDDDSDPFNKFWDVVENLVQKLSNPAVAFTTVPLNVNGPAALFDPSDLYRLANPMAPAAVSQIAGKPAVPGKGVTGGGDEAVGQSDVAEKVTAAMMESYYLVDDYKRNSAGKSGLKAPSTVTQADISGSKRSGLVDTTSVAIIPNKTIEEYAVENQQLKMMVDQLSRRVMTHEKSAEEANILKSSIIQFRHDVLRIKQSQDLMRSSVAMGPRHPTAQFGPSQHLDSSIAPGTNPLQRRIKDLEDEVRILRTENGKQRDLMAKYRERWEKLKESAKKRRSEKQAAANGEADPTSTKLPAAVAAAARPPLPLVLRSATRSSPLIPPPKPSTRPISLSTGTVRTYLPPPLPYTPATADVDVDVDAHAMLPPFAAQPMATSMPAPPTSVPAPPTSTSPPTSAKIRLKDLQHHVATEDELSKAYSAGVAVRGMKGAEGGADEERVDEDK